MFDIGWQELFIIAVVTIVVVGPKELPRVLRAVTMGMRKIRGMASDFQNSIDELARESELHEIRRDLERSASIDFEKELEDTIDPTGEVSRSVREIEGSVAGTGEELADPTIEAPRIGPASETGASETGAGETGAGEDGPAGAGDKPADDGPGDDRGIPRSGTSG